MADVSSYRIEVSADPANPGYHRWAIFQNAQRLDLPGYAYASAWSAEEAARTALRWHLILTPLRSQPEMGDRPSLDVAGASSAEAIAANLPERTTRSLSSRLTRAHRR